MQRSPDLKRTPISHDELPEAIQPFAICFNRLTEMQADVPLRAHEMSVTAAFAGEVLKNGDATNEQKKAAQRVLVDKLDHGSVLDKMAALRAVSNCENSVLEGKSPLAAAIRKIALSNPNQELVQQAIQSFYGCTGSVNALSLSQIYTNSTLLRHNPQLATLAAEFAPDHPVTMRSFEAMLARKDDRGVNTQLHAAVLNRLEKMKRTRQEVGLHPDHNGDFLPLLAKYAADQDHPYYLRRLALRTIGQTDNRQVLRKLQDLFLEEKDVDMLDALASLAVPGVNKVFDARAETCRREVRAWRHEGF